MKYLSTVVDTNKYIAVLKAVNFLRNAVYIGVSIISAMKIIKIYKAIKD